MKHQDRSWSGLSIHVEIRVSPVLARWGMAALLLFGTAGDIASEDVALTTYYPAPSGVYTQMIAAGTTYLARNGGFIDVGVAAELNTPTVKMSVMNGNVGIGTTSPAGRLEVVGSASNTPAILMSDTVRNRATFATSQPGFGFAQNVNVAGAAITSAAPFVAPPANGLYVQGNAGIGNTVPSAPNGKLDVEDVGLSGVILNAGNVGIGLTAPRGPLDVNGDMIGRIWSMTFTLP